MNILIIHQNFPGQFKNLVRDISGRSTCELTVISRDTTPVYHGVRHIRYRPKRSVSSTTHNYLRTFEDAVLHGQQVLRVLLQLERTGYRPAVILAHPGWGEALFIKDAFPDTPLINFCEYYYHATGADTGFDPEFPASADSRARLRIINSLHLLNLEQCDVGVTPTRWQHSLHPAAYRDKIKVIHEGIDFEGLLGDHRRDLILDDGQIVHPGCPIITYVARNLEPYRGFHVFMRSLSRILKQHNSVRVVIVGGDGVSYGSRPRDAASWREKMTSDISVADLKRIHFLGKVSYAKYKQVLSLSSVHVYLTYPFVLSWSLLEAMAMGCVVLGSKTKPVEEVVTDGINGYLVGFFDSSNIADQTLLILNSLDKQESIKRNARNTAYAYSSDKANAAYWHLINSVVI
ncbi:glycosyltransferase family 4 protein [Pseudomonas syringae pv. syringae]|uniref:glycosyltransferase family 4 protein n=1 Tax=Pseudomonas TaxID=286 RepID=UPI0006B93DBB|nr:glycosyltransferase family 4 protein [Pseudomonas syringae]AVB28553.1 glycosyl transferase family 1 [Pseudomonas syringae pv. syringae]KWS14335.1 glycosyl transferase family 1 [Pseudomonas syringae pv. syringae]MCF5184005.1 glycosyltransferase [Pseudomonas syringae]MCF5312864.1 glycosyltransferase [Pseudomonas syringae]MCF5361491.1 glycosyltransferase [Pseudomonas syringae]